MENVSLVSSNQKKNKLKNNLPSFSSDKTMFLCGRCQTKHGPRQCPAFGQVCKRCGLKNHFAVGCRVKNIKSVQQEPVSTSGSESDSNLNCWKLTSIQGHKSTDTIPGNSQSSWSEKILIEDLSIKCKLDTGADISVMPLKIFRKISKSAGVKPTNTNVHLQAFDGSTTKPIGRVNLKCEYNDKVVYEDFMIVNSSNMILGLPGCLALNLVKRVNSLAVPKVKTIEVDKFINKNKDVFSGTGRFPDACSIPLKVDNPNIFHPATRVPQMLMEPLKKELERLQSREAIVRVEQISPNACVNKIVIVEKQNGKIRLCLDPRDLNEFVVRRPKVMPTLEEVASKLKK